MVATPFPTVGTASAVLALSKAAWKLGTSLSKLDQDTKIANTTIRELAGEVKSLSNECDLVYAELEERVSKSETRSTASYDFNGILWNFVTEQVEEIGLTIQHLELFIKNARGEESSSISQSELQRKLGNSKDQIISITTTVCKHTNNLRTTLLLINT
jgi:hypothetical protein